MSGIAIALWVFMVLLVMLVVFIFVGLTIDSRADRRRKKGLKVVDIGDYSHGLYGWLIIGTKAGRIEWKPTTGGYREHLRGYAATIGKVTIETVVRYDEEGDPYCGIRFAVDGKEFTITENVQLIPGDATAGFHTYSLCNWIHDIVQNRGPLASVEEEVMKFFTT